MAQIKIIDLLEHTNHLTPKITEGYGSICYAQFCNKVIEETIWVRKINFTNKGNLRAFKKENPKRIKHIPIKFYHLDCAKRLNMI